MVKLETEIDIAVPPSQVWQILTDFKTFPEWNPLLEVVGQPELGAKLAVKANAPDGSGSQYQFRVNIVDFEPDKFLAWKGGFPGVLSGYHYWRLFASGEGTHLVHGENFSGLYVWLKGHQHFLSFRPAYEDMNTALAEQIFAFNSKNTD